MLTETMERRPEIGFASYDRFFPSQDTIPVGAVGNMIHPLSAPTEILFYLNESKSTWAVTLDAFYGSFAKVLEQSCVKTLLLARISDYLSPLKRAGF